MLMMTARLPERAPSRSFRTELVEAKDLGRIRDAWGELYDRSAECNVFYGPDMLEPLVTGPLGDRSFRALLAWREDDAAASTLAGFMPLHWPSAPFAPVVGLKHHYIVGAAPLLDAETPVEAAEALLDGLARLRRGALLVLDDLRLDWPACKALAAAAQRSGRIFAEQDVVARAGVSPQSSTAHITGKFAQNLRRSASKLTKLGGWTVTMSDDPAEARAGLEALLAIEASGWKGEAGTALASNPDRLAYARRAFDPANQRPKPRFSVLSLDGKPIAVSMHLIGHDSAANLKCAYDEAYSAASPGVLLDAAVAEDLKRFAFTDMVDSVALPGHPVERLWPERLRCGWIAVSCDPSMGNSEFRARLAVKRMQRDVRRRLADLYNSAVPALRKAVGRG